MAIFLGENNLERDKVKKRVIFTSSGTLDPSTYDIVEGSIVDFVLIGAASDIRWGNYHEGSFIISDILENLTCTVGAYQDGNSTISGLGEETISSSNGYRSRDFKSEGGPHHGWRSNNGIIILYL